MDVHPPHEPVHTWRDALMHLGIVTVGLFIALMLEGLVEYVHHRSLVREVRENIRQELQENDKIAKGDIAEVNRNREQVKANLAALRMIEADPRKSPSLSFSIHLEHFNEAAWLGARDAGALGFMPFHEVESYADLYGFQTAINEQLTSIFQHETESLGPIIATQNYNDIPKTEFVAMEHENAIALVELGIAGQLLQQLDKQYVDALKGP